MYETLEQFADRNRREYAASAGLTLEEMQADMPDRNYEMLHAQFVECSAKNKDTCFTAENLDNYYQVHGRNALRLLIKFYPHVCPKYYVHPDCREKGN